MVNGNDAGKDRVRPPLRAHALALKNVNSRFSHRSAFIGPMQQSLALARTAPPVTGLAGAAKLSNMPTNCNPSTNLSLVFVWHAPTSIVAAVPLEPSTRVVGMYPALRTPNAQWLTGINAKPIECRVFVLRRQLRLRKPAFRKLVGAISKILAPKYANAEHFCRRQVRLEIRMKVTSSGSNDGIAITPLHAIVDLNPPRFHALSAPLLTRLRRHMENSAPMRTTPTPNRAPEEGMRLS